MKKIAILASAVSIMSLGAAVSCASGPKGPGYKKVKSYEVDTVTTKEGKTELIVSSKEVLAFEEVIERSPNVSAVAQVTKLEGTKFPSAFTVSPDGETVLFGAWELQPELQSNLWSTSSRGTGGLSRITAGNYLDLGPSYSDDGSRVYFSSNRNSVLPRIWSIKATGAGGISMLTQGDSWDFLPCADVKHNRVFFGSRRIFSSAAQIWSIGLDGGLPTQLTEGWFPKVSPDGEWLLYSSSDPETKKLKIWKMKADGVSPTQLTSSLDSVDEWASWSPDGQFVVFSSDMAKDSNGNKNFDIWIMRNDGGGLTQLTTNGSVDSAPVFGPDGKTVFFGSNRGFRWEIWRMEISASLPTQ
jgi:Tol biopolymer transport system component